MSISVNRFKELFGIEMDSTQISALMQLVSNPDFLVFEEFLKRQSEWNKERCVNQVLSHDEDGAMKLAVTMHVLMSLTEFREDISQCVVPNSSVASHGK